MNELNKKIICHDAHNNEKEVEAQQLVFRPSVYGVLIENNKVLLSKQWDGYDFPGGGINVDETIEQALKREFLEETGIEIALIKPIACATSFFHPSHSKKYSDQYWNCLCMYFLVKKIGGDLSHYALDEEELSYADKPEWVCLDDVGAVKFYNSIDSIKTINDALAVL